MALRETTRSFRTASEEERLIEELLRKYPNLCVSDVLRAALRFGLKAAKERPVEVLLGATEGQRAG